MLCKYNIFIFWILWVNHFWWFLFNNKIQKRGFVFIWGNSSKMGILMVKYRCLTNSIIIFLSEIRTGSRKLAFLCLYFRKWQRQPVKEFPWNARLFSCYQCPEGQNRQAYCCLIYWFFLFSYGCVTRFDCLTGMLKTFREWFLVGF